MKFYVVAFLTASLLLSCDGKSKDKNIVYLGGQIVNPNNNYITLSNPNTEKDTIFLDQNNRFSYQIKDLTPGLYTFTHGGEMQTVLLEPRDSLLFRLNTNDFDESLVYTGKGSKKNNFLIQAFLRDEIENKAFKNSHQLEPEAFEKHLDSLKSLKQKNLDRFYASYETSELFYKIADAGIAYNYYAYKEMYPFGYYGNNKLIHVKDLPDGFYDYRSNVNFNDINLTGVYAYNNFLNWYFHNTALKKYYHNGQHLAFNRQALDYNLEKLRLIDSVIENETIQNYVLKYATREFIFNSSSANESLAMLDSYIEKSTDLNDKTYLTNLASSTIKLYPGNKLPEIDVVDYNSNTRKLSALIKRPTVIYCWSSNFKMHYRNSHYMMRSLKARYPEMDYIAININDMNSSSWKKTLEQLEYPTENEYLFKNPNEAVQTFAIAYSHKVILVDADGILIESNANLFSPNIAESIEKLIKE
ncbi:hypothetical protein ESY86_06460 [Subsaximicrobium wynnwilliamsii]|uniref:Thioredoxin domain-containing protein n=1 Tax=Subsaximicrobium wynnwilliamsii TaxID=291179 RepID=A0A5C6ZLH8_9FLAO|nr:hypothetical protein [Subsaximicrobium wynnwilliamsii]TXD84219.1 hypothetical protein ESY87_06875 [Subsaximicrobium wynnwilliamsii]TXD89840.1 hypothetical protein ESY86_06460 [Subsaximicrobium wynnwilliamsii]TXE03931.1 hypothetical protein ESY88_06870 [Subsaximicrobium wynnwilliamsii]